MACGLQKKHSVSDGKKFDRIGSAIIAQNGGFAFLHLLVQPTIFCLHHLCPTGVLFLSFSTGFAGLTAVSTGIRRQCRFHNPIDARIHGRRRYSQHWDCDWPCDFVPRQHHSTLFPDSPAHDVHSFFHYAGTDMPCRRHNVTIGIYEDGLQIVDNNSADGEAGANKP